MRDDLAATPRGSSASAGVEPRGEFATFFDLDAFVDARAVPLPEAPRVIFVGVLERYKNVEGLAAAWRLVAGACPGARAAPRRARARGRGRRGARARGRRSGTGGSSRPRSPPRSTGRARSLLPSASEGLPRVAIEAFVRGRAVVGARAGGIPDIVEDGVNGLLVEPGDVDALAAAIERSSPTTTSPCGSAPAPRRAQPRWVSTRRTSTPTGFAPSSTRRSSGERGAGSRAC